MKSIPNDDASFEAETYCHALQQRRCDALISACFGDDSIDQKNARKLPHIENGGEGNCRLDSGQ
jgi:hypothetical protein